MIYIAKGDTPEWFRSLAKRHPRWQYKDLPADQRIKLRESLLKEQYYLCGYCCCEIQQANAHNEHLQPQSTHPAQSLSYDNLIASCMGYRKTGQTCGHRKLGSEEDILSPLEQDCESQFTYNFDGRIEGLTDRAERTIEVLNLNAYDLVIARKAALYASVYYPREELVNFYQEPVDGRLLPFCNIVRNVFLQYNDQWEELKTIISI